MWRQSFKNGSLISFCVLCALYLSACGAWMPATGQGVSPGQVEAVQATTAVWGVQQALMQRVGTVILRDGSKFLFGWGYPGGGWAWWGVDVEEACVLDVQRWLRNGGSVTNVTDFRGLVDYLVGRGWMVISASQVPRIITSTIAAAESWLNFLATSTAPTIIILPIFFDANGNPILPGIPVRETIDS